MPIGIIKWFSNRKGYGFITFIKDDSIETDIFFHYTAIANENDDQHNSLNEGDEVEFEIVESTRGLKAQNVKITKKK